MKKLRIIIGSLNIGGTEKHLAMVLPLLAKKGWKIRILTTQINQNWALLPIFEASGIQVNSHPRWLRLPFLPEFVSGCIRILANVTRFWIDFLKDRTSITHFFLPEAYLMGMTAALLAFLNAPTIMSRRSMNFYQRKRSFMRRIELKYHRKVTGVLGNSQRVVDQLINEEAVSPNKVKLIYNGIDTTVYEKSDQRALVRDELGISTESLVLILVANLMPYKGHADLIHALGLIKKELPSEWQLLCVGKDNAILSNLCVLAKDQGIESQVRWLGLQRDVSRLLSASDIGLLCSHEEGFSNAILEGMATGLPMIVTDVGGNAEAVVNGETGFVVPPKNPVALSQAIHRLASNPALLHSMGIAGKKRVQTFFNLERCVEQYQQFYNAVGEAHLCAV